MNVELRHLRAFVAVAEELNFTRAAERMHIAQQALSKQIRQLEERVGTDLLERTTRKVELTPAGMALLEQARPLLAGAEQAVDAARQAAGSRATLTVGFVASVTYDDAGVALARFRTERPDVDVLIKFGDLLDPSGGVRGGEADIAFTHGPFDTTGLEVEPLWSEPMGILMAADHRLATGDISLDDVLAEPSLDFPTPDAEWRAFWTLRRHRGDRPPRIAAEFKSLDAMTSAVRSGLGVALTADSLGTNLPPGAGMVYRRVEGLDPLEHQLAWREGDTRPVVQDFAAAARAVLG